MFNLYSKTRNFLVTKHILNKIVGRDHSLPISFNAGVIRNRHLLGRDQGSHRHRLGFHHHRLESRHRYR